MTTDGYNWFDYLPSDAQEELVEQGRELERLRAENAAMREIVQAVANNDASEWSHSDGYCSLCGEFIATGWENPPEVKPHAADCPVTKARDLLGKEDE